MPTDAPANASLEAKLIEQFYHWELRGRGWGLYPLPVSPEPPFRPFQGHYLEWMDRADDGRKPTFLSRLFEE